METDNWNPGHTIDGGFPHEAPASLLFYKNRPKFFLNQEGKVEVSCDAAIFKPWETDQDRIEFLFNRNFQAHEALDVAENQIRDMLREYPFVPESFGFEVAHKNEQVIDVPVRIYVSKFDPAWSLYRKPKDRSVSLSRWILIKKLEHGKFHEIEVDLPCARVAYALLWGLCIKMKADEADREQTPPPPPRKREGTHTVWFRRDDSMASIHIDEEIDVSAETDQAAMVKAKFMLETEKGPYYSDIKFEELSIVPRF